MNKKRELVGGRTLWVVSPNCSRELKKEDGAKCKEYFQRENPNLTARETKSNGRCLACCYVHREALSSSTVTKKSEEGGEKAGEKGRGCM